MPVYHARCIAVRLGSMPLAETTTSDVILKKGEVARRQSEAAEEQLIRSGYLDEKRVPFPGDRSSFELNWLGTAPFMQAQVDPPFAQSSGPYTSDQEHRTEPNVPQALTLHIKLSDKAFLSGFDRKTHLKIEVLFNGQLSACSLIHTSDIRSGAKSLHQVFAGYRVDFLAERPWVLLPPFTTADGGSRRFRKTITPTERWEEVSAAILEEAEERGTDRQGEAPPSAVFLHALASMHMPECVKTMQKPGGRKFGTVDVIITAGFGSKLTIGTNYLKRPQRLRDSNYAVRTEIKSDEEVAAAGPDHSQETTARLLEKASPYGPKNMADARQSCAQDTRPRKRRALSSVEGLPQHLPKKSNFQSPFLSGQIPVLPPPIRHTFQNGFSTAAGTVSPRCPSPDYRSDGHKEPLPANDRNRTYNMTCGVNNAQERKIDASDTFQDYHSPPPEPDAHAMQADAVNLALPSMPLSSIGGRLFVGSPSVSSSMPHTFGYHTSPSAQPIFSSQMDTLNPTTHLGPSSPFVAPTALMLSTPTNWPAPLRTIASPYYHPVDFQQQAQVGTYSHAPTRIPYVHPSGPPSLMPGIPSFHGYSDPARSIAPVVSSRAFPPPPESLPRTALLSVPSKPRRGLSPDKIITTNNANVSRSSVLVSRLIITGRNGKLVVDHIWKFPQHVFVNTIKRDRASVDGCAKTPALEHGTSHEGCHALERNHPHNKSSQADSRATSPTKKLQSEDAAQHMDERRRDSVVELAIEVPLPYLKRHQGPANKAFPVNYKIDVPDKIAPFVPAHMLAMATPTLVPTPVRTLKRASPAQPTVSQCRTFSRSSLPGIQGPKAATFLFDDPEEVLREAARMRRSRSPTKPAATPSVLPLTPTAHVEPTIDRETPGDSSPLSSVPSSPLHGRPADTVNTADAAPDQIPQLDGFPECKPAATSPRKLRTPSPTKPSFLVPNSQRPSLAIPHSTVSTSPKKRKGSHQSPTKPPRSPDRLKTVDNPPLNHDCVIALAESVDKTEERGVLRQVKGERQGVFREEYVALAVRFFIAGD